MKTRNIDEAAYLLTKGHRPQYRKLAQNEAEFVFKNSDTLKKDSQRFLKGEAMVNVVKYLYARTYLKQSISKEDVIDNGYGSMLGRSYYYIDEDNASQHATFSKNPCHIERYESGNYFVYKNDAVAEANKRKHPLYKGNS